jgi:hypothetical protein
MPIEDHLPSEKPSALLHPICSHQSTGLRRSRCPAVCLPNDPEAHAGHSDRVSGLYVLGILLAVFEFVGVEYRGLRWSCGRLRRPLADLCCPNFRPATRSHLGTSTVLLRRSPPADVF